jgi:hypothetical protein
LLPPPSFAKQQRPENQQPVQATDVGTEPAATQLVEADLEQEQKASLLRAAVDHLLGQDSNLSMLAAQQPAALIDTNGQQLVHQCCSIIAAADAVQSSTSPVVTRLDMADMLSPQFAGDVPVDQQPSSSPISRTSYSPLPSPSRTPRPSSLLRVVSFPNKVPESAAAEVSPRSSIASQRQASGPASLSTTPRPSAATEVPQTESNVWSMHEAVHVTNTPIEADPQEGHQHAGLQPDVAAASSTTGNSGQALAPHAPHGIEAVDPWVMTLAEVKFKRLLRQCRAKHAHLLSDGLSPSIDEAAGAGPSGACSPEGAAQQAPVCISGTGPVHPLAADQPAACSTKVMASIKGRCTSSKELSLKEAGGIPAASGVRSEPTWMLLVGSRADPWLARTAQHTSICCNECFLCNCKKGQLECRPVCAVDVMQMQVIP